MDQFTMELNGARATLEARRTEYEPFPTKDMMACGTSQKGRESLPSACKRLRIVGLVRVAELPEG